MIYTFYLYLDCYLVSDLGSVSVVSTENMLLPSHCVSYFVYSLNIKLFSLTWVWCLCGVCDYDLVITEFSGSYFPSLVCRGIAYCVCIVSLCLAFCICDCVSQSELPGSSGNLLSGSEVQRENSPWQVQWAGSLPRRPSSSSTTHAFNLDPYSF